MSHLQPWRLITIMMELSTMPIWQTTDGNEERNVWKPKCSWKPRHCWISSRDFLADQAGWCSRSSELVELNGLNNLNRVCSTVSVKHTKWEVSFKNYQNSGVVERIWKIQFWSFEFVESNQKTYDPRQNWKQSPVNYASQFEFSNKTKIFTESLILTISPKLHNVTSHNCEH